MTVVKNLQHIDTVRATCALAELVPTSQMLEICRERQVYLPGDASAAQFLARVG